MPNSFIYFHLHINYFITRLNGTGSEREAENADWKSVVGVDVCNKLLFIFLVKLKSFFTAWDNIDLHTHTKRGRGEESTSFICHKININWQINEKQKKKMNKMWEEEMKIKKKKARPSNKIVFIFYLIISIFKYTSMCICVNEWAIERISYTHQHTDYIVSYTTCAHGCWLGRKAHKWKMVFIPSKASHSI